MRQVVGRYMQAAECEMVVGWWVWGLLGADCGMGNQYLTGDVAAFNFLG